MQPTIVPEMYACTLFFVLDLIPSQTHGQNGNRDADTAPCRSRAYGRAWKQSARPAGASLSNCQIDACRVEFLTAGENPE